MNRWRKSSRSVGHDAGNCVEVGEGYRKARRSMNNGNCAEVGTAGSGVLVRDTADRSGPVLRFPVQAWTAFTASLAGGWQ